jgi:hypothetical protein
MNFFIRTDLPTFSTPSVMIFIAGIISKLSNISQF